MWTNNDSYTCCPLLWNETSSMKRIYWKKVGSFLIICNTQRQNYLLSLISLSLISCIKNMIEMEFIFVKSFIKWHKEFINIHCNSLVEIWEFKFIITSTANTYGSLMSSSTFICLRFLLRILLRSCNKILLICIADAFECRLNGCLLRYNLSALQ